MSEQLLPAYRAQLADEGFCILRNCVPAATIGALQKDLNDAFNKTPFGSGDFYGFQTKRFGSLLRRSQHCAELVLEPTILNLVQELLRPSCDLIQLNVAQAISVHPGEIEQFPHRDHDMWPCEKQGHEYLVNVIWPLTPFRNDNGATRIYPETYGREVNSLKALSDPIIAECEPGDAIMFLGSTVHGAGPNRSDSERRAVVIGYSLGWLKPYENNWLAYPPHIARHFPPELAALAGYRQHRPNLGNFEGQCPSILFGDELPEFVGAIDALLPDQTMAVKDFALSQQAQI